MNRSEIQTLIDAAPDARIGFNQAGRPVVSIPYGEHTLDGSLFIPRRMDVTFNGSTLVLPNGVQGIEFQAGAWGARVRDVCVFGQAQNPISHGTGTIGILIGAYGAQLEDVYIRSCGKGLAVLSNPQTGLSDSVQIKNVSIFWCDTGFHLKGGDTNGGTFTGMVIHSCRVGILDESFLGNTFVGTQFHTIAERAYHCTVGANYSTFAGSYVEIDCGSALSGGFRDTIDDKANITWLGGGGSTLAKAGTRVGLNSSRIRFGDFINPAVGGARISVTIPHASVYSGVTIERQNSSGSTTEGMRLRWVDAIKQAGIEAYKPNVAGQTPTGDGLTRPISWTAAGHTEGFGHTKTNAQHYSVGAPNGYNPEWKTGVAQVERVLTLPSPAVVGKVVEIIDTTNYIRTSYLGILNGQGLPAWQLLS